MLKESDERSNACSRTDHYHRTLCVLWETKPGGIAVNHTDLKTDQKYDGNSAKKLEFLMFNKTKNYRHSENWKHVNSLRFEY